mgnify:CR=1 FL=1
MKRRQRLRLLFTFVLLVSTSPSFSQSLKDFFSNKSTRLTYLGIDYTKNLFYKNPDADPTDIRDKYYTGINDLVVKNTEMNSKIGEMSSDLGDMAIINQEMDSKMGEMSSSLDNMASSMAVKNAELNEKLVELSEENLIIKHKLDEVYELILELSTRPCG